VIIAPLLMAKIKCRKKFILRRIIKVNYVRNFKKMDFACMVSDAILSIASGISNRVSVFNIKKGGYKIEFSLRRELL